MQLAGDLSGDGEQNTENKRMHKLWGLRQAAVPSGLSGAAASALARPSGGSCIQIESSGAWLPRALSRSNALWKRRPVPFVAPRARRLCRRAAAGARPPPRDVGRAGSRRRRQKSTESEVAETSRGTAPTTAAVYAAVWRNSLRLPLKSQPPPIAVAESRPAYSAVAKAAQWLRLGSPAAAGVRQRPFVAPRVCLRGDCTARPASSACVRSLEKAGRRVFVNGSSAHTRGDICVKPDHRLKWADRPLLQVCDGFRTDSVLTHIVAL